MFHFFFTGGAAPRLLRGVLLKFFRCCFESRRVRRPRRGSVVFASWAQADEAIAAWTATGLRRRSRAAFRSSSLWRLIIDCASADVRDPNASNLDDPAFHLHRLSARSGEAIADQTGHHIDVKPVREQRRPSAAARSSVIGPHNAGSLALSTA